MMRPSREVLEARDAEFERAETAADVDRLQERWLAEDAAAARAQTSESKRLAAVERRIGKLERTLDAMPEMLGEVIGEERNLTADRLAKALADARFLTYRGTWEEQRAYTAGTVVTTAGGAWVAITKAEVGDRPGKGAAWRLMAKGTTA